MERKNSYSRHQLNPDPELDPLHIFIGKWQIEGENLSAAPVNPNTSITGEETYEWLPGGFFIINMWDRESGDISHKGVGIIGFDDETRSLTATNYDNFGYARKYRLFKETAHIWKFEGQKQRALLELSSDGTTYAEKWEILAENNTWLPLCILKGTKIQ